MCVCLKCTGVHIGQNRALDLLELELQDVMSLLT